MKNSKPFSDETNFKQWLCDYITILKDSHSGCSTFIAQTFNSNEFPQVKPTLPNLPNRNTCSKYLL